MNIKTIGIIGYGKIGKIRADSIKILRPNISILYYDPFIEGSVKNVKDIINNPDVDIIIVCTPNNNHKDLTIQSLKNNKHVFCEKPPVINLMEMKEVIEAEKLTNKKLMYGFNHRHHESIKKIKEIIDSGVFGNVLWIRGRYGKEVDKNFYNDWRSKKEIAGGGIFFDQGIHMLDLFLYIAEDFDEVKAIVSNLYWKLDVEDNVFAIFENNKTGIVASLHSTMTQWRHLFSLEIFLEKGSLILNGLKTPSESYGQEILTITQNRTPAPSATWGEEKQIIYNIDNSWNNEMDYFLNCVENDVDISICGSKDALKIMKIVDMIYK